MQPSRNLFLVGATGAGKTSIGRRLAAHYALPFVDLDQEIEQRAGVSASMIFEVEGEAGFRERECALLDACSQRDGIILSTGAGAILAAGNREHLAARGFVVWLQTSVDQQLARLRRDASRPLLDGTDRRARLQSMADTREPLYRAIADLVVPDEAGSLVAAGVRCVALVDQHWRRPGPAGVRHRA